MAALCAPTVPAIDQERSLIDAGHRHVAGVDEVGRGALAGPVVAAAVVLRLADDRERAGTCERLGEVRDSKALDRPDRARLAPLVEAAALAWSVGWATAAEVDMLGIGRATWLAMRRSLAGLAVVPDAVLVDGLALPSLGPWLQRSIVKGDGTVLSIAAASVVAKVHRDAWMIRLDEACAGYGFASHKGYGATTHRDAIAVRGATTHHRLTWRLLPIEATSEAAAEPAADERTPAARRIVARRPQADGRARGSARGRPAGGDGLDDPGAQLALPAG
ncbi:MAG: ribonuclease HII [Ardenticatenales bacterium]|nr:ribonuclease HII [Ardenticatenales bacterium]